MLNVVVKERNVSPVTPDDTKTYGILAGMALNAIGGASVSTKSSQSTSGQRAQETTESLDPPGFELFQKYSTGCVTPLKGDSITTVFSATTGVEESSISRLKSALDSMIKSNF